ncbi:sel1 repeat family protein [Photobacterium leiognathi]|uniref:hypothetical protein n=1 Tax=Photobacterium leiognathi TaxID=553611 RepID=UPI001EDEBF8E|nr:hypothetical protein [Photobacterium leiognathi]MCG3884510.1 sel1 repeat family protein [Photobacterium leiognathi]
MALNRIGKFHLVGEGELVKKDIRLAIKYLETAADQGDPTLQLSLAEMYQYGKYGFPVSESKAKTWYARAAVQERLM